MQVVSRDAIWLLSHIRVISSELPEYARATATSAVDVGAFTLCSQHNRFGHGSLMRGAKSLTSVANSVRKPA
jgi:hypothetical protein